MRRLLLALLLLLGVVPATASAALDLGIQDDAFLTSAEPNAWPLARALKPSVIRYNVDWASVAAKRPERPSSPSDPAYDWTATDTIVRNASALGARVLLTIVQAPRWANGGGPPRTAPRDAADYGAFCRTVAMRYSGAFAPRGGGPALPRVSEYTVWNEPNRGQFLQPQGAHGFEAPKVMAGLMRACAGGIHAELPDAQVALGPLASRGGQGGIAPIAFLARYRAAGGPRPQVVALNPYLGSLLPVYRGDEREQDGAITVRNLDRLEHALEEAYGDTVPIWLTEFAWRTAQQPGIGLITPARQAELAEQSVDLIRSHYPYAGMLVWFLIRDVSPTSYWRSGLVDSDNHRKPAFAVWARLTRAGHGESRIMLALRVAVGLVAAGLVILLWRGWRRARRRRRESA